LLDLATANSLKTDPTALTAYSEELREELAYVMGVTSSRVFIKDVSVYDHAKEGLLRYKPRATQHSRQILATDPKDLFSVDVVFGVVDESLTYNASPPPTSTFAAVTAYLNAFQRFWNSSATAASSIPALSSQAILRLVRAMPHPEVIGSLMIQLRWCLSTLPQQYGTLLRVSATVLLNIFKTINLNVCSFASNGMLFYSFKHSYSRLKHHNCRQQHTKHKQFY
jgi:hypothetical protein